MRHTITMVLAAVLAFGVFGAAHAQYGLVNNGGFETASFQGWTHGGETTGTAIVDVNPYEGNFAARLGTAGPEGYIFQNPNIATTPGAAYTLFFGLRLEDGHTSNGFRAEFGPTTVLTLTNSTPFGWTEYSYPVIGSGNDGLLFAVTSAGYYLDNVRLYRDPDPVPEGGTLAALGSFLVTGGAWLLRRRTA